MRIIAAELIRLIESDPELKRALQDQLVDADAVRRALQDPEKRDEIRRVVLGDEWEDVPTILRQLAEGQQRHEAILQEHTQILKEHTQQLAMLIETAQRHEAILQEHTQQLAMLIETAQRHEAILQEHTQQLAMLIETAQRHEAILQEHTQILQEHTQQLAMLIETVQRHEAILQEHTQILKEHTQQLAMLIETVQRHEAILQEHTQILKEHTRILQEHTNLLTRLDADFQSLRGEFQGLSGRFEGENYERRTLRRAPAIFNGGGGGPAGSPSVRRRLKRWLRAAFGEIPLNGDLADVYLSDIIWWKDGTVVVGEISIKVDRLDVLRAKYRAQLLERAGVNATPIVIGDEWALEETRDLARDEGVEWVVAKEYSDGAMEFRRLPDTEHDDEGDMWEEY